MEIKYLMVISIFAVLLLSGFGQIRFLNEVVYQNSDVEIHTNVVNNDKDKMKDVSVNAYIPELGVMVKTNNFNVLKESNQGKFIFMNLGREAGNVPKGEYLVRLHVHNDNTRDTKYRYIVIQ